MATMKEIAELSGVSRGTVDRVLNHRGIVNAETERKVLEIAKLLDYQPNKAGIALAAQKKKFKIGVFGCLNSLGKAMAQDIGVMPSFTEPGKFEIYIGGLLGN